jgi:integrase
MRRPYTLYKETNKSGTFWYARFWDETRKKYAHSRSTGVPVEGKRERRWEAERAAEALYAEFTQPHTKEPIAELPAATPVISHAPLTPKAAQPAQAVADMPLIQYLEEFWTGNSEYARYKRDVKKKPLTPYYIAMNHDDVQRHMAPFPGFAGVTVGGLTKALLKKWMIWLAGRNTLRRKKDGTVFENKIMSGRLANSVLQSMRVAIRWAVDNEDLAIDPFRRLGEVAENLREKGVLTMEERNTLIAAPISDPRRRLSVLLGCLCSMRRGEVRGLQWGDIEGGLITIRHNYQDKEGVKLPKYNSVRKVPVPAAVQALLEKVKNSAGDPSPGSFVLESPDRPGKPLCTNFFREAMAKELTAIGISENEQKKRFLTFHSMRHTFVTLAQLAGIPDVEIRALSGHKDAAVMAQYSHVPQVIDFDEARRKIEATVQVEKKLKVANL